MTKGEIFDVLDNSGKWWQVARIDGSGAVGISPSNCKSGLPTGIVIQLRPLIVIVAIFPSQTCSSSRSPRSASTSRRPRPVPSLLSYPAPILSSMPTHANEKPSLPPDLSAVSPSPSSVSHTTFCRMTMSRSYLSRVSDGPKEPIARRSL